MSVIYSPYDNGIINEEEAKKISDVTLQELEREAKQKGKYDYYKEVRVMYVGPFLSCWKE